MKYALKKVRMVRIYNIATGEHKVTLNDLRTAAADGLDDLTENKENAAVLRDEDHPYWKWKEAFRQKTMQRMAETYRKYYK